MIARFMLSIWLKQSDRVDASRSLCGRTSFAVFEARDRGLSLGDCICLSVAAQTGQTVVTADRTCLRSRASG